MKRTFTPADREGLLAALRAFSRATSGERLRQERGAALVNTIIESGVPFDIVLNPVLWNTFVADRGPATAEQWIEWLGENADGSFPMITDNPDWHSDASGFTLVADMFHEYYLAVTGKGGQWNTPSALQNLARVLTSHPLETIMSSELIDKVKGEGEAPSCFAYVHALMMDFNTLDFPELNPAWAERAADGGEEMKRKEDEGEAPEDQQFNEEGEQDDGDNFVPLQTFMPNDADLDEGEQAAAIDESAAESNVIFSLGQDPQEYKKCVLFLTLQNYTLNDIRALVSVIDGSEEMTVTQVVDALVEGRFDPTAESADARRIHMSLNGDLLADFIKSANIQGMYMDETVASHYDLLHDSWNIQSKRARKLNKMRSLIISSGLDDPDMLEALNDIESLYKEQK